MSMDKLKYSLLRIQDDDSQRYWTRWELAFRFQLIKNNQSQLSILEPRHVAGSSPSSSAPACSTQRASPCPSSCHRSSPRRSWHASTRTAFSAPSSGATACHRWSAAISATSSPVNVSCWRAALSGQSSQFRWPTSLSCRRLCCAFRSHSSYSCELWTVLRRESSSRRCSTCWATISPRLSVEICSVIWSSAQRRELSWRVCSAISYTIISAGRGCFKSSALWRYRGRCCCDISRFPVNVSASLTSHRRACVIWEAWVSQLYRGCNCSSHRESGPVSSHKAVRWIASSCWCRGCRASSLRRFHIAAHISSARCRGWWCFHLRSLPNVSLRFCWYVAITWRVWGRLCSRFALSCRLSRWAWWCRRAATSAWRWARWVWLSAWWDLMRAALLWMRTTCRRSLLEVFSGWPTLLRRRWAFSAFIWLVIYWRSQTAGAVCFTCSSRQILLALRSSRCWEARRRLFENLFKIKFCDLFSKTLFYY